MQPIKNYQPFMVGFCIYEGGVKIAKGKYQEWVCDDGLLRLQGWARDGLTDQQIAHNMDINVATLYAWKNKYSDISDTLKKGKEVIDIQVENALLKRALGYEYTETTEELTDKGMKVTKKVTKQIAPDTTAQIFWLKNRKPQQWRDKQEIVTSEANQIAKNIEALNKSIVEGVVKNRNIEDLQ